MDVLGSLSLIVRMVSVDVKATLEEDFHFNVPSTAWGSSQNKQFSRNCYSSVIISFKRNSSPNHKQKYQWVTVLHTAYNHDYVKRILFSSSNKVEIFLWFASFTICANNSKEICITRHCSAVSSKQPSGKRKKGRTEGRSKQTNKI